MTDDALINGAVVGGDGIARCAWGDGNALLREYHDAEWGMPVQGDQALFERLMLEAFQSGLSWITILRKRENFRAAFAGFDPEIVADYGPGEFDRLMNDAGIVRNRLKIEATITNAQALLALREANGEGAFERLVWSFRPDETPKPRTHAEAPTKSAESLALSKGLKKQGFVFVGPTTAYALMEATGIVDTHLLGCHRRGTSGIWPD
ncbi:MAG: DNA-3-methyladenine glycosylase I [Solirubrobacteraceae bacterium]|nr:DNA-3-methyladenine glycosylase I [Solirubrobacteraceae bacterium]